MVGRVTAGAGDTRAIFGTQDPFRHALWRAHDHVRRSLARAIGPSAGVPLALTIGERGFLDRRFRQGLIDLGVSHLFALSGMHLGLVAAFIMIVATSIRLVPRLVLPLTLSLYVGVVGHIVSLERAYVMALGLSAAHLVHRPLRAGDTLSRALLLLLVLSPQSSRSVAFQLSFVATFAVLLSASRLRRPTGPWVRRLAVGSVWTVLVSFSVQVWILPLQLAYFNGVSVTGALATVVLLPFVVLILSLSFGVVITGLVSTGWAGVVGLPLLWFTRTFERIVIASAAATPGLVPIPEPEPWLYYAGLAAVWMGCREVRPVVFGGLAIAASFFW